jgi:hypothetical protein
MIALVAMAVGVLILFALPTAESDELQISIGSRHYNKDEDLTYNETNPGLFYAHSISDHWSIVGGAYRNTYEETSFIIGGEVRSSEWRGLSVGGQLGIATGYDELTDQTISPMGTLFGQYQLTDCVSLRLSVIPNNEGAAGLSVVIERLR